MLSRKEAIEFIFDKHPGAIYVTNTGYISRAVYDLYPENKNIFYMQGSMGLAPCIGLGIATNTDREVIVLSGDAALLMHLGITHTIEDRSLNNLYVYVLDNGCHESVGGFWSTGLEETYLGIDDIIRISKDGKKDRVDLDCKKNTKQIKKQIKKLL